MFAKRLKELRIKKGITQVQFAKIFNISSGTIAMWETNKRTPDYKMLIRIANYFNVTVDYLLGNKNVKTSLLTSKIVNEFNKKNISISDLSILTGIPEKKIADFFEGKDENFGWDNITSIANILDLPIKYLAKYAFGYNENSNNIKKKPIDNINPLKTKKIPLLGGIACGKPIYAEQEYGNYIDCNDDIKADFALVCKGDSMINARINDGDVVFIRSQPTVDNGEIACVVIDDEATLKRVYLDKNRITLVAENPKYAPMVYSNSELEYIRILGKAVAFQSEVR